MWLLSQLSKATSTRPSEIVDVDDPWAGYQFDQAVLYVGRYIQSRLDELDKNGRPVYSLNDLLDDAQENCPIDDMRRIQGIVVEKR